MSNYSQFLGLPTTSESSGTTRVSVSAGNGSKGSWVQLIASTAARSYGLVVTLYTDTANSTTAVDIGTGGAGSEVVVLANLIAYCQTLAGGDQDEYYIPITIPA